MKPLALKMQGKLEFFSFSRCKNTKWKCTERECPGICSAFGDPHYETFDKKRYEFHGDCTYVLAEDFCGDGIGTFRITVENVPCSTGGVTCTKAVKVSFNADQRLSELLCDLRV